MFGSTRWFGQKRVVVLDQSLMDEAGHHLNVALALSSSLGAEGYKVRTLAFRSFPVTAYPELNATAHFLHRTYDSVWSALSQPGRFEAISSRFDLELEHALAGASEMTLVLPTLSFVELHALSQWIINHPKRKQLKVFFWLVFGPEFLAQSKDQIRLAKGWYAAGFQSLEAAQAAGASIQMLVETDSLKQTWRSMTQLDIEVLRLPSMVHFLGNRSHGNTDQEIVIGYAGDVREGKGFELLPDIIRTALTHNSLLRFNIRVAVEEGRAQDNDILRQIKGLGARVSVETGSLPPLQFQNFLAACDLILLPYDPAIYRIRGSSICDEAEVIGLPMVLPEHAAFSQKTLRAGSAQPFETHSAECIGHALIAAIERYDVIAQQAATLRESVHNQNQEFLKLL